MIVMASVNRVSLWGCHIVTPFILLGNFNWHNTRYVYLLWQGILSYHHWTLLFISRAALLEEVAKKSLSRNWFGRLKVLNDTKLALNEQEWPLNHFGSLWYHSELLEVPYSPKHFTDMDFFTTSYSKAALDRYLINKNQVGR